MVSAVSRNDYATSRVEAELKRHPHVFADALHVQAIVTRLEQGGLVIIELVEVEQKTRQEREERALDQAQANKELIRNLARNQNPLGGIRGAAQLLQMELESKSLTEYTRSSFTRPTGCSCWWTACWLLIGGRTWLATSTFTKCASGCGH